MLPGKPTTKEKQVILDVVAPVVPGMAAGAFYVVVPDFSLKQFLVQVPVHGGEKIVGTTIDQQP